LRNVALAAMELATLERLFPGRLVVGVGHGVQAWMAQAGARVQSPLTLLEEYATALRRLLDGERVSVEGRYVRLDDVALDWAPATAPPLMLGGVGPRSLALAAGWVTATSSAPR
jgi:alkanesulfonate monooxygenase SsuD/methylene tetrahydromethanopterin reductase-like flavin-dependent oxidoreductase (luciferase family)